MRIQDTIRGFRPSRYGLSEEPTAEARHARETSIRLYARLVRQGRVLFEDEPDRASPAGCEKLAAT